MDYQTIQCLHLLTFKHHDCLQNFSKAPTNDQVLQLSNCSYVAVVTRSQLQWQIILWRKVEGHPYQIQCRLGPTFEVDRHSEAHCCTLMHTVAHWGFGNHCFPGHLSMLRLSPLQADLINPIAGRILYTFCIVFVYFLGGWRVGI